MVLENKLKITDQVELARQEEKISKKRAKDIFEKEDEKNIEHNFIKYLVKELKEQL